MNKILKLSKAKNGVIVKVLKQKFFFFLIHSETYVYNEDNAITKELTKLVSAKDD